MDLDVFTGPYGESPRDLSDIVFITDSYTRVQGKHVRNVIPVTPYGGSKKDLSMIALGRYLKMYFSNAALTGAVVKQSKSMPPQIYVKDVRDKIQADFKTTDYLS